MAAEISVKKQEVEQVSSSKRHFHWTSKVSNNEDEGVAATIDEDKNEVESSSKKGSSGRAEKSKKVHAVAVTRLLLRSLFRKSPQKGVVLGTLFGNKHGHVHFAFQNDAKSQPALLIQLATPITGLVREMGSGSVRIALESEKKVDGKKGEEVADLLEERLWRTYCNGIKCGMATRMECGGKEWKILKAVEPISMGAGVLPPDEGEEEEVIYMRAKFDRVVGNSDSQAFYMLNPDNNLNNALTPPELSIYLLRL